MPLAVGDTVEWDRRTIPRTVVAVLPEFGLAVVVDRDDRHQRNVNLAQVADLTRVASDA